MLMPYRVAEFLPGFQDRVREALTVLLGEKGEKRVRMGLAKDGSGVGGQPFPPLICHQY
jgi:hexokinase